jgi:hypothetical protein
MITRGRWSALYGPSRIPSTLPPEEPPAGTEEEQYSADMARRMLEFELDPANFFKMPRGSGLR